MSNFVPTVKDIAAARIVETEELSARCNNLAKSDWPWLKKMAAASAEACGLEPSRLEWMRRRKVLAWHIMRSRPFPADLAEKEDQRAFPQ